MADAVCGKISIAAAKDENRADLWNRASDTLSSINDLARDQDKLNESLGKIIRAR